MGQRIWFLIGSVLGPLAGVVHDARPGRRKGLPGGHCGTGPSLGVPPHGGKPGSGQAAAHGTELHELILLLLSLLLVLFRGASAGSGSRGGLRMCPPAPSGVVALWPCPPPPPAPGALPAPDPGPRVWRQHIVLQPDMPGPAQSARVAVGNLWTALKGL